MDARETECPIFNVYQQQAGLKISHYIQSQKRILAPRLIYMSHIDKYFNIYRAEGMEKYASL